MMSDCSSLCNDTISTIENAIGVVFELYNANKNSNNSLNIGLDLNRICDYSLIGLHAFITDQVAKYVKVALRQKYDCTDKSANKIAAKIIQHGNPQNIMDLFDFLEPDQSKRIKSDDNYDKYHKLYKSRNAHVHENGGNKLDITHIESNKNKYYNFLKELDNMIGVKDDAPEFIP